MSNKEPFVEKPRMGEWVQLAGFVCGALGLFATGVMAFGDLKDHDRRLSKIEDSVSTATTQKSETNERLARIEERLNMLVETRKDR